MSRGNAKAAARRLFPGAALLLMGMSAGGLQAQEVSLDEMQRNIEIFSGVLREGLGLNTRAGIFSPLNGSVRGTYFMKQGVVLEVISPLGNSRSSINWQSLEGSLQQLSGQISDFVSARTNGADLAAMRESMALSLRADTARGAYADLLEQLRNTDFSAVVEESLKEVSDSARSLHQWGRIDDARLREISAEVSAMRDSLNERVQALMALRAEAGSADQTAVDDARVQQLQARLEQWRSSVASLQEKASGQAREWVAQAEQAKQEREQEWQVSLAGLETTLFELSCSYSAALRSLPDDEHLTLVLKGLGAQDGTRYEDRIHVLDKRDILRCQQGEITPAELQARASTYSY
ncbi:MAG: hypothetical protein KDI28_06580 [Pseudomonadales bacterium]|nr:hypothetical protein [Pseudomonadales bacterium]MCP5358573.1 hypothetical protein [Pseudomonadales bacterium]